MKPSLLALLAAGVALTAACGTTVPISHQVTVGGVAAGDGSSGTVGTATASTEGATTSGGSTLSAGTGGTGSSGSTWLSGTGSAAGSGSTGSSLGSSTGTVAPTDHSPVQVGFFVFNDAGKALAAAGYSGLSTGDGTQEAKTAAALINSRGGLGGHPIKPVIYAADAATIKDETFQSACSMFFEDNTSVALVSITQHPILAACAAAHHAPMVAGGSGSTSQAVVDKFRALVLSSVMTFETIAAQLTDDLARTRFFTPYGGKPVNVGLVYLDAPEYAAVKSIVSAHLTSSGLSLTDSVAMPADDPAVAATAGRSAALKFASEGVTHVLTVDNNGFGISWFSIGAQGSGYYPHYGLSTIDNLGAIASSSSAQTLAGAQGIGWSPVIDMPLADQKPLGDHSTTCSSAMAKAGIDMSSATAHQFAVGLCDATYLLQAAVARGSLTAQGFVAGLSEMSSFRSAMVFATNFDASRAAARGYRSVAYQSGCGCFQYSSAVKRF